MTERIKGRSRATKPIPPTYPNVVYKDKWDTKDVTYVLTEEQLKEVREKYGEPLRPLGNNNHDISKHRQSGKKAKK